MKTKIYKSIIYTSIVGVIIALILDLISDRVVFSQPSSYLFSIIITMISYWMSKMLYLKILIRKHISLIKKFFLVYGITSLVYLLGNLLFSGFKIFTMLSLYIYGILILILISPLIYGLNKSMSNYNKYLVKKQQSAHLED